jgi:hypothetical protein
VRIFSSVVAHPLSGVLPLPLWVIKQFKEKYITHGLNNPLVVS